MRVLVFEYITGGGLRDRPIITGLFEEGDLMVRALVAELLALPGVSVTLTRDSRLAPTGLAARELRVGGYELERVLERAIARADAVWPIAPESDGLLEALCARVVAAGKLLLNSRPHAVALAASKLATARRLAARGIPVVPTWPLAAMPPPGDGCWVVKPDTGVGCIETRLFTGRDRIHRHPRYADDPGQWVVQPFVKGQPASLSLLVGDGSVCLLGCNLQRIVLIDDRFQLLGCVVNGLAGDRRRYRRLCEQVADAIPGLWGYVGIDFIQTADGPVVLEVNPRLTTAYAGLGQSLGRNVAGLVTALATDPQSLPVAGPPGQSVDLELELNCAI